VRGPAALGPLLQSYILHASGPGDALAARLACRAALAGDLAPAAEVDARLEATKLAAETRAASRRCGRRVLMLGEQLYGDERLRAYTRAVAAGDAPGHQAVALALLGAAAGLDEESAALLELHTFAVSLVGAAVRLGALEHTDAQALLLRAHPAIAEAAAAHAGQEIEDIGGFAPQIDVMQFRHRHADAHMFVS
jgi:urease accessory protein